MPVARWFNVGLTVGSTIGTLATLGAAALLSRGARASQPLSHPYPVPGASIPLFVPTEAEAARARARLPGVMIIVTHSPAQIAAEERERRLYALDWRRLIDEWGLSRFSSEQLRFLQRTFPSLSRRLWKKVLEETPADLTQNYLDFAKFYVADLYPAMIDRLQALGLPYEFDEELIADLRSCAPAIAGTL